MKRLPFVLMILVPFLVVACMRLSSTPAASNGSNDNDVSKFVDITSLKGFPEGGVIRAQIGARVTAASKDSREYTAYQTVNSGLTPYYICLYNGASVKSGCPTGSSSVGTATSSAAMAWGGSSMTVNIVGTNGESNTNFLVEDYNTATNNLLPLNTVSASVTDTAPYVCGASANELCTTGQIMATVFGPGGAYGALNPVCAATSSSQDYNNPFCYLNLYIGVSGSQTNMFNTAVSLASWTIQGAPGTANVTNSTSGTIQVSAYIPSNFSTIVPGTAEFSTGVIYSYVLSAPKRRRLQSRSRDPRRFRWSQPSSTPQL